MPFRKPTLTPFHIAHDMVISTVLTYLLICCWCINRKIINKLIGNELYLKSTQRFKDLKTGSSKKISTSGSNERKQLLTRNIATSYQRYKISRLIFELQPRNSKITFAAIALPPSRLERWYASRYQKNQHI